MRTWQAYELLKWIHNIHHLIFKR